MAFTRAGLRWLFVAQGTLKEQALRGTIWLVLAEGFTRLAGVIKIAVLGRLLSPRDFGLLGIALLIQEWVGSLTQTGISATLVRQRSDIRSDLDTAWTIGLIRGFLVCTLIFFLAPWGASYFDAPEAAPIVRLTALLTLLWELVNPGVVYLRRELNFRKDVTWRLSGVLPGLLAGLVVALLWRNVWALAASLVAARIAEVIASYRVFPYRPRLQLDWRRARRLLHTAKWFSWMNVTGFFEHQLDSLATARLLGAGALGYYQVAAQLALLPTVGLGSKVEAVLFPTFARVEDSERLRQGFLTALQALALVIALPVCVLTLYPELVTGLLLGPKWSPVAAALAWLAGAGFARVLGGVAAALLQASGRLRTAVALQVLRIAALGGFLYLLVPRFGFTGTAAAAAAAALVTGSAQVVAAWRLLGLGRRDFLAAGKPTALVSLPFLVLRIASAPLDSRWELPVLVISASASVFVAARRLRNDFSIRLGNLRVSDPVVIPRVPDRPSRT